MVRENTIHERLQLIVDRLVRGVYGDDQDRVLPWESGGNLDHWILEIRHDNAVDIVLDYRKNTRGLYNLRLLKDTGRDLLRVHKDQDLIGTSTQQRTNDFLGPDNYWWGQGYAFLDDVGNRVAFYLIYGCKADEDQVIEVMKSLGWHDKGAVRRVTLARDHFKNEYG